MLYLDMLADYFLAVSYCEHYTKPLPLKVDGENFSLIGSIDDYLYEGRGEITLSAKNVEDSDPMGMLLSKENGADILYSNDLNACWKRLVVAKELVHLIIDQLEFAEFSGESIRELLAAITNHTDARCFDGYDHDTKLGKVEGVARILSELVLVPWFEYESIKNSDQPPIEIAQEYRVPVQLIDAINMGYRDQLAKSMNESYMARAANAACSAVEN